MRVIPEGWWAAWPVDPAAVVLTVAVVVLYLRGASVRARATPDRRRRTSTFLLGCGLALLAVTGPIEAFSGELLWVHMVQHLLLAVVAAPLLAWGEPVATVRPALPPRGRRWLADVTKRTSRWQRASGLPPPIVVATIVHVVVLWLWHAPVLYDAALASPVLHLVEHATIVLSAVWFWGAAFATRRTAWLQGVATLCMGTMIVTGGVLGALMTFAGRPLYVAYTGAADVTALQDQELAGILMWVLPGFVYAVMGVRRFIGWIEASERELQAREARAARQAREAR